MASTGVPHNGTSAGAAYDTPDQAKYHNGNDIEAHNGHLPRTTHQSTISQVYKPGVANPGPLGLISFALTTFVIGFYQCGVGLPESNSLGSVGPDQAIVGLAIFFGGAAQFIAGILEFVVGNTFGTTVHCSYGAFWLSFAMFLVPSLGIKDAYAGNERAFSVALGIYLLAWCLLTLIFCIAAMRTNIAILFVLGCLTVAFFFLSVGRFIEVPHPTAAVRVTRAGGAFAIICALGAFYAGAAGIMRPETTPVRFPLGEFGSREPARAAKHPA
jgi:succinate-acetate transporter protein